jgi:hypothetical protein
MRKSYYQTSTLRLSLIALFALALSFTACKKDSAAGTSYIQFTNASELSSPLDFYVDDDKKTTTALAFNQSTSYFSVSSKAHTGTIKVSASGVNSASFDMTPQPGFYYSIFYFDGATVAYTNDPAAPASGKARVRFINLNIGLVDNIDFGITGGTKIVTGLISKLNSEYYDVAPGATFSAYAAGTTTQLINIPTAIEAGHIYTIFLSGQDQGSLKATVLLQK